LSSMSSIDPLFLVFLLTGFTVGFGHCVGMCGPIVVSLSLNLKGRNVYLPHLLYNAGRVTTYTLLGGLMGATGSFSMVASNIAGIQQGALIFAGIMLIIMALAMSGWLPLGKIFGDYYNPEGFVVKGFQRLSRIDSVAAYFPVGLLLGLLPCGPVYTALLAAAGAGMHTESLAQGILKGMGVMFCFGLGTVPALFLIAKLVDMGWLKKREIIYRIGTILMLIVGVYFIYQGIVF
jgi:sulfite exporter TauE/SafE